MYNYFQPNVLPQQQVLQANGKASIDALKMAPNSSALIMDTTAPIVWLCTSDSLGNVTSMPYDIAQHIEEPEDDPLEKRLESIESQLNEIINAKSNAFNVKPKQSIKPDSAD